MLLPRQVMTSQDATLLQRTFDTVDALATLYDPEAIFALTSKQFAQFGFSAFVLSRLPHTTNDVTPFILMNGWPDAWTERYLEAQHYDSDPLRRHCMSTDQTFSWREIPKPLTSDPRAAAVLAEAPAFGLNDGLCVPLHTRFGVGGLSLSGAAIEDTPAMRSMVRLLSFYVCEAIERSDKLRAHVAQLTPRERDVLSWVAIGATGPEIAATLGISEYTVADHLRNARAKLGARNNAHSVAVALRSGQISI